MRLLSSALIYLGSSTTTGLLSGPNATSAATEMIFGLPKSVVLVLAAALA